MLYLKNTLGGLGRSITDSARETLHNPQRWWRFALYAALFALPGGSIGVVVLAWFGRRRANGRAADAALAASAEAGPLAIDGAASAPATAPNAAPCARDKRADRPACRASAGKACAAPASKSPHDRGA